MCANRGRPCGWPSSCHATRHFMLAKVSAAWLVLLILSSGGSFPGGPACRAFAVSLLATPPPLIPSAGSVALICARRSVGTQTIFLRCGDESGRYRVDAHFHSARVAHDAGAGIFYGGLVRSKNALNTMMMSNPAQLGIQGVAVLASIVYSGALTFVLLKLIGAVVPLRTDAEEESTGLDVTQHGERGYEQ